MTQLKAATLKTQMKSEFAEIYNLCREVLDKAVKPSLIKATLETLLRFVNWVPVGYIFETDLIETLRNKVIMHTTRHELYPPYSPCHYSSLSSLLIEMSLSNASPKSVVSKLASLITKRWLPCSRAS